MEVKFFEPARELEVIGRELQAAFRRVFASGRFILGEEVAAFEREFAEFCGTRYALGVANGTDALFLSLKALGLGPGDEVITVPNTFAATALAITYTQARPVFVDIEAHAHLMDPAGLEQAITPETRAILPVHLYGECADMEAIGRIASEHGLCVLEDACQAHGASLNGKGAGSMGAAGAFSFYPTKNLGAYGDGGAIVTNDTTLYERLCLLRNYGQRDRYHYESAGYNSRLDELQAAALRVKLTHLPGWVQARQRIAERYREGLTGVDLVERAPGEALTHAYYVYVITVERRDALQTHLRQRGIDTLVHYPVPLHKQAIFRTARTAGDLPHAGQRAGCVLSLPMHPFLMDHEVDYVIECVREFGA